MRRITAKRLTESMQQAPHFYLPASIDADELVAARAQINEGSRRSPATGSPAKVSVNDVIVKAVASALRAHPEVNVSYTGEKLLRHRRINVGVAVALPDGLIVPVIRDADTLTITQISAQTRDLATRARAGKLKPEEFTGSTFSVSNLGMFGIDQFTAVINPPEAAILAVGATKQEPVVRDGAIVVGHTMRVTLSIDHRALDGATRGEVPRRSCELVREPARRAGLTARESAHCSGASTAAEVAELPVPRLERAMHRPRGMHPAEVAGVRRHPAVLRRAVVLDAAAKVDGEPPAVVARPGHRGKRRPLAEHRDL